MIVAALSGMRPNKHAYPRSCVRCYICGAAIDIASEFKYNGAVKDFMDEHAICALLKVPGADCTVPDCDGVGLGPMQKCADHGGYRSAKERILK